MNVRIRGGSYHVMFKVLWRAASGKHRRRPVSCAFGSARKRGLRHTADCAASAARKTASGHSENNNYKHKK
jgi:hypothetical protein